VVPQGTMAPSIDTELTLPELSNTDFMLLSGRLKDSVFVAWSLALPTPSTIAPEGARIVPDCVIGTTSTSNVPSAESDTCDGAPEEKGTVVSSGSEKGISLAPTAPMITVSPLAG
jgi:hypothetical protein